MMDFPFQVKEGRGTALPNRVLYFLYIIVHVLYINECILAFLRTEIPLML